MPNQRAWSVLGSLSLLGLAACGGADGPQQSQNVEQSTGKASLLATACSGCHSDVSTGIASLQGYSVEALQLSLSNYKSDAEGTTVMHRLARGYSETDIALISQYLGAEDLE
ncbi:MAG: hypothetical protein HRT80_06650 [Henriciella sp.]|nr:hypothetical protein [Henriciella sp.]